MLNCFYNPKKAVKEKFDSIKKFSGLKLLKVIWAVLV